MNEATRSMLFAIAFSATYCKDCTVVERIDEFFFLLNDLDSRRQRQTTP